MTATTMIRWSQRRYGGPEVLTQERVAVPAPGAGEVRMRVAATALNSADARILRGDPLLIRLAFGLRRPRTPVPGRDVAGTVVAVGAGVTSPAVGDLVAGELSGGGLAEYATAPADRVVVVPEGVDAEVAATLPLAGGTAWQALDLGAVTAGSRVLIVGAGGGVGTFAVRLAVLRDAEVDAVCGSRALDTVRALGARTVADHRGPWREAVEPDAYDAVIDIAGSTPLRELRQLLRRGGVVVLVSGGTNRVWGPLGRMLAAAILSLGARLPRGSGRTLRPLAAAPRPEITARLLALAAAGALRPPVERRWPLADARAAIAHIDAGHTVGKVVVDQTGSE